MSAAHAPDATGPNAEVPTPHPPDSIRAGAVLSGRDSAEGAANDSAAARPVSHVLDEDDFPEESVDCLSMVCPSCGAYAEWPDCTECGSLLDQKRVEPVVTARQQEADRLALIVPEELRALRSWLLWKRVPQEGKKDRKVPVYCSGTVRHGEQGSPNDRAQLATFDQVLHAFRHDSDFAGIGLAMVGDNITALDFDQCVDEFGNVDPEVLGLVAGTYTELSPSGRGLRAFLRGTMANRKHEAGKAEGIEVFSTTGFVTVTGNVLAGSADIVDLTDERYAAINARLCRPEFQAGNGPGQQLLARPAEIDGASVDPRTVTDLRSALNAIPSDSREDWVYVGQCLRVLGNVGLELWLTWSQRSEKYDPADAARVWKSLDADGRHGIFGVFAKAQGAGWVNPTSNAAQGPPWKPNVSDRKFAFVHARELLRPVRVRWLIERYIEANTSGLLFGASTAGKSFLAIDWACCVATGTAWQGHAVERGAVFIVAGEGHAGIGRRLRAWELHNGVELGGAPLYVSVIPAALISALSAAAVREAVQRLIEEHGQPALIIVDTLARNLGAGDESSAEDIGAYVGNLDVLRTELMCTVLTVHHSGHGSQDRARGSSALKAAVDHEFRLELHGDQRLLTCTKAKDAEPPTPLALALKVIKLESWAFDGEDAPTSCALVPLGSGAGMPTHSHKRLTGVLRIAVEALRRAIDDHGVEPPAGLTAELGRLRAPAKVVDGDHWRDRCYKTGIADGDQPTKQKAFARARNKLRDLGHIGTWDQWFWYQLPC